MSPTPLWRAWLAGLLCGCAGQPLATDTLDLGFPHTLASYSWISDYRTLAHSVAPVYATVTVLSRAGANEVRRGTGVRSRVVSGASGIMVGLEGHVVTAAHIARSTAFQAEIKTMNGERYAARILRIDPDRNSPEPGLGAKE